MLTAASGWLEVLWLGLLLLLLVLLMTPSVQGTLVFQDSIDSIHHIVVCIIQSKLCLSYSAMCGLDNLKNINRVMNYFNLHF